MNDETKPGRIFVQTCTESSTDLLAALLRKLGIEVENGHNLTTKCQYAIAVIDDLQHAKDANSHTKAMAESAIRIAEFLGDELRSWRAMYEKASAERNELQKALEAKNPTESFRYASTQHTICAGCGVDKHTPLRRDHMGGYVCLTCIDKELDRLCAIVEKLTPHP